MVCTYAQPRKPVSPYDRVVGNSTCANNGGLTRIMRYSRFTHPLHHALYRSFYRRLTNSVWQATRNDGVEDIGRKNELCSKIWVNLISSSISESAMEGRMRIFWRNFSWIIFRRYFNLERFVKFIYIWKIRRAWNGRVSLFFMW